jgi:hypothetical protein
MFSGAGLPGDLVTAELTDPVRNDAIVDFLRAEQPKDHDASVNHDYRA